MGRAALTIDEILAKFPIKSLPPIQSEPSYDNINELIQLLYANAASVATSYGGATMVTSASSCRLQPTPPFPTRCTPRLLIRGTPPHSA